LIGFLEYQRATFAHKTHGLDAAGLAARIAASSMTLGGMLNHLAFVEDHWFSHILWGNERGQPWRAVDWDSDPDWDWRTAADCSPQLLTDRWRASLEASRRHLGAVDGDLSASSALAARTGDTVSVRWILVHMIEEYARHNGHADLFREAIDGSVGE